MRNIVEKNKFSKKIGYQRYQKTEKKLRKIIVVSLFLLVSLLVVGGVFFMWSIYNKPKNISATDLHEAEKKLVYEQLLEKTGSSTLPFIKNAGQKDEQVKFYAPIENGTVYVNETGITYDTKVTNEEGEHGLAIQEKILGLDKNPMQISPEGEAPSEADISYYVSNNREEWKNNLENYQFVNFKEVYPKIEFKVRATEKNIEKLFIVDKGGNYKDIKLSFDGIEKMEITQQGELKLISQDRNLILTAPQAYQYQDGKKKYIAITYELLENNTYGFSVENYDSSKILVIDPMIASTLIGGGEEDRYEFYSSFSTYAGRRNMLQDSAGNIYIVGHTRSSDYPTTLGVYDTSFNDADPSFGNDIVVSKFNADLTNLIASTYLGGTAEDNGFSIALDSSDNIYVTGFTKSSDFPMAGTPYQSSYQGGDYDVFVAKLSNNLTSLMASTYLGGSGADHTMSMLIDGTNLYLAGDTDSSNFPVTAGVIKATKEGTVDSFISKFDLNLSSLTASSFFGGNNTDFIKDIEINSGNIYLTGYTNSNINFASGTAYSSTYGGGDSDAFVASINTDFTVTNQATYLGGTDLDYAFSLDIDSTGNIIVTGSTKNSFPVTAGVYDATHNSTGLYDGFVSIFSNNLSTLTVSTYIGGNGSDEMYDVIADTSGNIYVSGFTTSTNYPSNNIMKGVGDGLITKFNSDLTQMIASTLIGGTANVDKVFGLDITADGKILASGITDSTDFPTTVGAYQTNNLGKRDIFISKMDSDLTISQTPHHIQLTVDGTATPTLRAGMAKTLVLEAKDILNANLLNYNGDHIVQLSGAVNAPDGTVTTCNGINFGANMTLTFTDGVASCELLAYMANNTQSFDATEIGGSAISTTANVIYDLSPIIQPGTISAEKSIVETPNDNFSAGATVTVRVNPYDIYQNQMGANGNIDAPVVNISVTGTNSASINSPSFTYNYFQGTYIGTIAGHDYVNVTINGVAVGRDNDPDTTAPYDGSNGTRNILGFDHVELTVGGVNSISGTVDQTYALQVWAKNSLRETLTTYTTGSSGDGIYFSGATDSPYGFKSTCTDVHNVPINFGDRVYRSFSKGLLSCNLVIKDAQSATAVEAGWAGKTSNADAEYDLDLNITPGATDHLNIRETAQAEYHSDTINKDAGQTTNIIVSARDQYGNINTAYSGDHNILFSGATNSYGKSGTGGTIPTVNGDTNAFHDAVPSGTGITLSFVNGETSAFMILYDKKDLNQIEVEEGVLNSWSSGNASITLNNLDLDMNISSSGNIDYTKNEITSYLNPNGTCGELGLLVITRDQYGNQLEGEHAGTFSVNLTFDPISTNNPGVTTPLLVNNNDGSFTYSYVSTPGLDKFTGTVDGNVIVSDFYPATPITGDLGSDGIYLQEINSGYNKRTWTGAVSSDWDNPANWAEGTTPLYCSYVVISRENYLGTNCSGAVCQPTVNLSTGVKEIQGLYLGKIVDPFAVAPFDIETTPHTYHNVDADGETNLTMFQASLTNYLKVNDDLIIYEKGLITHTANTTTQAHIVNIEVGDDATLQASDLDASGIVDADEKGEVNVNYRGYQHAAGPGAGISRSDGGSGASYGGFGTRGKYTLPTSVYGSLMQPSDLGSGGGDGDTNSGGAGGGAIKLTISGTTSLFGNVTALGANYIPHYAGGGSGGSVWMTTGALTGTGGVILANGGAGYGGYGGGGGGGRIAVYYTTDTSNISYQAYGRNGYAYGGAGTIYLKDVDESSGNLIIDNDNQDYIANDRDIGKTPISETIDFRNITIRNYGNLDIQPTANITYSNLDWATKGVITDNGGNFNLLSGGGNLEIPATARLMANTPRTFTGLTVNGTLSHSNNTTTEQYKIDYTINGDCTVNIGGAINVDYRGYQAGYGPGYTASVGASYGGSGGNNSKTGYGSIKEPNNIGSGGDNFGGGAIKLSVSGILNNSGSITASGTGTASGSGGGIWLDVQTLTGTNGVIYANGGNGSTYGGGGGRIAMYYVNDTSTNLIYQAFGGTGTYFGGAGTIYKKDKDDLSKPNGDLIVDNNNKNPLNRYIDGRTYLSSTETFDDIIVKNYGYLATTTEANIVYSNLDWANKGVIGDNGGTFALFSGGGNLTIPATAIFYENYTRVHSGYTIDGFMETIVPISTIGDFNIGSVGTVTHKYNTTTQLYILDITANNLSIAAGGKIDVNYKGYQHAAGPGAGISRSNGGGGASYGGVGGKGKYTLAGSAYGSLMQPSDLGSGGGDGYTNTGGAGGGAIKLTISGTTNLFGSITALGANYIAYYAGGGSGGSVWMTTGTLTGTGGVVSASGGAGYGGYGGGGGGGRIAVYYTEDSSSLSYQAYGNTGYQISGPGTIYLSDTDNPENNKLIIDNNGLNGLETPIGYNVTQTTPITVPVAKIYFTNNAKAVIEDGATLDFSAANNIVNSNQEIYTKLLLHGNGENGSTVFSDSSFYSHPFTASGNAQISTAQSKFGGSSIYFDGNDYIETPDSTDWDFSGDFTIDFWAKHNAISTSNTLLEIGSWTNSLIVRQDSASSFCLHFNNTSYCNSYSPNFTWHHYAISRSSGIIKLFIDGVQIGSNISNTTNFQPANVLRIGSSVHTTGQYLNGYIDEFRVSKDIARWTSNFTPPTSEYDDATERTEVPLFPTGSYLYHKAGSVIFNPDATITNFTFIENAGANFTHNNVTIGTNGVFEQANYHYLTDSPLLFNNFTIASGGTLTHSQNTTELNPPTNSIYIKANNFDIQSGGKIDVSGKGWNVNGTYSGTLNSGAGHGGIGGASSTGVGGATYDSGLNPSLPGSRGFGGGSGGGSARIIVDNNLTNDGDINANGLDGAINTGGGSGGSVLISAKDLNGSGNIFSKGGNTSGTGGSGAGGRIAVYYENKDDYTGSTPLDTADYAGGTGGNASGAIGTFYMASADHYTISGSSTQTAGMINPISVYLKDENNNDYIYDGVRSLTFSGANPAPDGTNPTCTNNLSANINFGLPTEINFLSGQSHSDMTLFGATAPAQAEIDADDGTFSTFGDVTWDLDVAVSSGTIQKPKTILDIIPNPADISLSQPANITVTTYDTWDNQMTSGGEQVDLTLTGNNGPLSFSTLGTADHLITDNNNGTYTTNFTPNVSSEDLISGTIGTDLIDIIHDTDYLYLSGETDDGIYRLLSTDGGASHYQISGSNSQTAGTTQAITISAKDDSNFTMTNYTGQKTVRLSGAANADMGEIPTCLDYNNEPKQFGQDMTLNFISGQATCQMTLYKDQTPNAHIDATEQSGDSLTSTADLAYGLDVDVVASAVDLNQTILSATPNPINVILEPTETISVLVRDQYQNNIKTGTETVTADIDLGNDGSVDQDNVSLDDPDQDGNYTTTYNPTEVGTDLIITQVNASTVIHDNDGTSDGNLYVNVTVSTYTVIFQDWDNTILKTETVNHGSDATAPTDPTRTGYTFSGWDNSFTNVTADITVTAQYTINTYTVTFDKNGGDTEADPTTKIAVYNTTIDSLPTAPTKASYAFSGWNTQADGAGDAFTAATLVTENITVYAIWTAINQYTLTYTANQNGTILGESSQIVNEGENGKEVEAVPNEGYHFTSWSDGVLTAKRIDINVIKDILVFANFEQNEKNLNLTATIGETMTLTCGSNIDIDNGSALTPETPQTNTTTCTVTTNDEDGYNLQLTNDRGSNNVLYHETESTNPNGQIIDKTRWDPSNPNAIQYTGTGLAFGILSSTATKNESWWGNATTCTDTNQLYAGIPNTTVDIMRYETYSNTQTDTTICYYVNVPFTQIAGEYTGSVTYTATGRP